MHRSYELSYNYTTGERDEAIDTYEYRVDREFVLRVSSSIMETTICTYGKTQEKIPWWQVFFTPFEVKLWITIFGLFLLFLLVATLIAPVIG